VETQVTVLSEQMLKLLAFLEEIQVSASNADDRGRRVGAGVTLDFFATSANAPTRATV
jgi:hypothetical protein